MPKNKSINLLPQEEFDVSIIGRTLKWAMGTFRIIVIVTEMIVMAAFLSRFWLDSQNSDLTDAIKVKSAQISDMAGTENTFRDVQNKLVIVKQIDAAAPNSKTIDAITSEVPPEITLSSISISPGSVLVKGISTSEIGIAQFIANLKSNSSFTSVNLGQMNSSEDNSAQTIFSVNISN
jgi:Tfp pilus assembly protein PilN